MSIKISIVTVVYNRVKTIERAINSVLQQTYPHIEYIVIDGASTDGTVKVIEKYKDQIEIYLGLEYDYIPELLDDFSVFSDDALLQPLLVSKNAKANVPTNTAIRKK